MEEDLFNYTIIITLEKRIDSSGLFVDWASVSRIARDETADCILVKFNGGQGNFRSFKNRRKIFDSDLQASNGRKLGWKDGER